MPPPPPATDSLRMEVRDALSAASGDINEDGYAVLDNQLWVIDGASGLSDRSFTPGPTDAAWLTTTTLTRLRTLPPDEIRITLGHLVTEITSQLTARGATSGCAPHELPSASLVAIRLNHSALEVVTLGDCRLILRTNHDRALHVTDSPVLDRLDRAAVEQLTAIRRGTGLDLHTSRTQILDLLRHNRDLLNRPGGYPAFSPDLDTENLHCEVIGVDAGAAGLLVSDGLYRLVDTFHRYAPGDLLEAAAHDGLALLIEELRALEAADPEGHRYPRLKTSDDATAVLFEITATEHTRAPAT